MEFCVCLTLVFDIVGPWRAQNDKLWKFITMFRPRSKYKHVSRDVDRPVWGKFYLPVDVRQVLAGLSSLLQWLTGDIDLGLGR